MNQRNRNGTNWRIIHNFDRIISLPNLLSCWDEFKRDKRRKTDVLAFEFNLEDNLFQLHDDLINQLYSHGPYSTFQICDPKPRTINKALVRDRLVQHLVFKELYRLFDPTFIYHSYSSRLNKGTHLAVLNLELALRKVSRNYSINAFVLKCDIRKFFASVCHQKLLAMIKRKISEEKLLWLIEEIISSFAIPVDKFPLGGGEIKG